MPCGCDKSGVLISMGFLNRNLSALSRSRGELATAKGYVSTCVECCTVFVLTVGNFILFS